MVKLHKVPELPLIHFSQKNDIVDQLLEIINIHEQNGKILKTENDRLKEMIAELQNAPKKPKIKPSSIEKPSLSNPPIKKPSNEPKIDRLVVHKETIIQPSSIPEGSIFKGYRTYFVQDIELKPSNTLFKVERWQAPDGKYLKTSLPKEYQGFHFGPQLRAFILQQYHQARVTQPKLLQELLDWGIEISEGELNHILSAYTSTIETELNDLVKSALETSAYIQTDDTGARHQGNNYSCSQIGNHLFTYLNTGTSKSRLHFLELLNRDGKYLFNHAALEYLRQQGSLKLIEIAKQIFDQQLDHHMLETFLSRYELGPNHMRTLKEGALVGFLSFQLGDNFIVLSDGAPQYAVLQHASCWVHALRLLEKEKPIRGEKADDILGRLCFLYHHLKRYKIKPNDALKKRISNYFDLICDLQTGSKGFDEALKRFFLNKSDLLRVLENPEIPLHNNLSENDLREYVVRRKISGGTRSDLGRRTRDVFCSVLKTCMKLGINFWNYLVDRVSGFEKVPSLSDIIIQKVALG